MDEPTNHLDIETLTWLEQYLQGYPGAILIVSHDRYFLDKLVTQVYEISNKESRRFVGNYSKYLDLKSALYEQEMKRYEKQQDEIAKLEDFVQKYSSCIYDKTCAKSSETIRPYGIINKTIRGF